MGGPVPAFEIYFPMRVAFLLVTMAGASPVADKLVRARGSAEAFALPHHDVREAFAKFGRAGGSLEVEATVRTEALEAACRRQGRLDRELHAVITRMLELPIVPLRLAALRPITRPGREARAQ